MRLSTYLLVCLIATCGANTYGQEKQSPQTQQSFVGKLSNKNEDFTELKRQRRQLNNDISKSERDLRQIDTQIERLTKDAEEAPQALERLDQELRTIDAAIQAKNTASSSTAPVAQPSGGAIIRTEREYIFSLPLDELKSRRADREQRKKEINDRTARLASAKEDLRKKRDDLDSKQAMLVDIEDRIGVSLNVGTNQYIYRTLVSGIFAIIVFYLVSRFFSIVQDNDEVKKSIFSGEAGIQFITLFSIVIAVILFGILEILGANELSALLGGLSGYILGKTTKTQPPVPI